jgi:hypothetical protein
VVPASRFSKTTETGMRVFLKTHVMGERRVVESWVRVSSL